MDRSEPGEMRYHFSSFSRVKGFLLIQRKCCPEVKDDMAMDKRESYKSAHILVEDSDGYVRGTMSSLLTTEGYKCRQAETLAETSKILSSEENIDLIMCGIVEWAEEDFRRIIRDIEIIPVLVCTGDVGLVPTVLQMGAYDVILKPFKREQLIFAVARALEHRRLKIENFFLKDKLGWGSGIDVDLRQLVEGRRKARNGGKLA